MNAKTRNKMQKHFGLGFTLNDKVKIPLADIVSASYVMGAQNAEKFWDSIIEAKKVKDKANMYNQRYIKWRKKRELYSPNDRRYK